MELELGAHDGREEPGPDDLVGLWPKVHREHACEEVRVVLPASGDLGGERAGRPGVHDVGITDEAVGLAPRRGVVACRDVGRWIDWQLVLVRHQGVLVVDRAVGQHRVPDREGDPEEALARDVPVGVQSLDPGAEPVRHVVGVPGDLLAALKEHLAHRHGRDEPLARGDDLERSIALLEEFDRVCDRPRLAEELTVLLEQLDDAGLSLLDRLALELGVDRTGAGYVVALPARLAEGGDAHPPLAGDEGPSRQIELSPPDDVGGVAEGADHGDAGALLRVGELMGEHRDLDAEERRAHLRVEQWLVARIVGMGDERHARGEQLRTGGLDLDRALAVAAGEAQPVVGTRTFPILELRLAHCGAEVDVPEGRCLSLEDLASLELTEKGTLRGPLRGLADGGVLQAPVDAQAECAPQRFEDLLVGGGQLQAELDEVRPRDRDALLAGLRWWDEVGVVGERGVAADAVEILHSPLGR